MRLITKYFFILRKYHASECVILLPLHFLWFFDNSTECYGTHSPWYKGGPQDPGETHRRTGPSLPWNQMLRERIWTSHHIENRCTTNIMFICHHVLTNVFQIHDTSSSTFPRTHQDYISAHFTHGKSACHTQSSIRNHIESSSITDANFWNSLNIWISGALLPLLDQQQCCEAVKICAVRWNFESWKPRQCGTSSFYVL